MLGAVSEDFAPLQGLNFVHLHEFVDHGVEMTAHLVVKPLVSPLIGYFVAL